MDLMTHEEQKNPLFDINDIYAKEFYNKDNHRFKEPEDIGSMTIWIHTLQKLKEKYLEINDIL